jgi:hypothetical protein
MGDDERLTRTEVADPGFQEEAAAFFHALEQAKDVGLKAAQIAYGGAEFTLQVPPVGEGDRGIVYKLPQHSLSLPKARGPLCLKVARPSPSVRRLLGADDDGLLLSEGVRVPVIIPGREGRFAVKGLHRQRVRDQLNRRFDQSPHLWSC